MFMQKERIERIERALTKHELHINSLRDDIRAVQGAIRKVRAEQDKVCSLTDQLSSAEKLITRLQEAAMRPPVALKTETPTSVKIWANETFGWADIATQLRRARQEMEELLDAHAKGQSYSALAEEAADVCICLFRLIASIDPQAINKKMEINRGRVWMKNGDGTGYHKKESKILPGSEYTG